ncbi:MAG: hypothetical protein FWC73_08270 [Defluviitaleaceae bacterium]|nr:hypothetical protein [Defluviitaleaceae bacterium]
MGDKEIHNTLKAYFSENAAPPPELSAQVRAKLSAAKTTQCQERTSVIWIWSIVIYDIIISSVIMYLIWTIIGPHTIVYVVTAYGVMSIFAVTIIAIISQISLVPISRKKANTWHFSS